MFQVGTGFRTVWKQNTVALQLSVAFENGMRSIEPRCIFCMGLFYDSSHSHRPLQ